MDRSGAWRLSPAYDLTFSVDLAAPGYANKQLLSVNGKNEGINTIDLEKAGNENDFPNARELIVQVASVLSRFSTYAQEQGIDARICSLIGSQIKLP